MRFVDSSHQLGDKLREAKNETETLKLKGWQSHRQVPEAEDRADFYFRASIPERPW